MTTLTDTPTPPYYAVIFTSVRAKNAPSDDASSRGHQDDAYAHTAARMVELAQQQPGFLGMDSAREAVGVTVSYWTDLASIKNWKANAEHIQAQQFGRTIWYDEFKVRIAKVEKEYGI